MNITINGTKKDTIARDISELLRAEGYADKIVAVARNGVFVPKTAYADTVLNDGDDIEILAPMQGG